MENESKYIIETEQIYINVPVEGILVALLVVSGLRCVRSHSFQRVSYLRQRWY